MSIESFPLHGSTFVHTRTQIVLYDIHVLRVQFCLVYPRCVIILYTRKLVKIRDFREKIGTPGHSLYFRDNPGWLADMSNTTLHVERLLAHHVYPITLITRIRRKEGGYIQNSILTITLYTVSVIII